REDQEDDVFRGREIHRERTEMSVRPLLPRIPDEWLDADGVRIGRVMQDHFADVWGLDHRSDRASRNSNGINTPRNPTVVGSGANTSRPSTRAATTSTIPAARNHIPTAQRAAKTEKAAGTPPVRITVPAAT